MQRVDVQACTKVIPPHPCDPPPPCDPYKTPPGKCPDPILCLERIKNPPYPGETTRCRTGASMNVDTCAKEIPHHPCDAPITGCKLLQKKPCRMPILCLEKIKNPEPKLPLPPECNPFHKLKKTSG